MQYPPQIKKSMLIYCEGDKDQIFVDHIIQEYELKRNPNIGIDTKNNHGGSATKIITNVNQDRYFEYDKIVICIDNDWPERDNKSALNQLRSIQKKYPNKIHIVYWEPKCLEGLVLGLLGKKIQKNKPTKHYKDNLEALLSVQKITRNRFKQLCSKKFQKNTLQKASKRNQVLNKLLFLLTDI